MMFTTLSALRSRIYHGGNIIHAARRQKNFKQTVIQNAGTLFALSSKETEALANKAGLTLTKTEEFPSCFTLLKKKYKRKSQSIYENANISERMFQYVKNDRNPTKETALAIAAAMNMSLEDILRLLKSAGYVLSKSIPSDMVILWMLSNQEGKQNKSMLFQINETLYELELPLLMTRNK